MSEENKFALDGQVEGGDYYVERTSYKVPFIIFLLLFLLSLAYILIYEFNGPIFGRGLKLQEENKKLSMQHLAYRTTIDSLLSANDLLLEQTNTPEGVWFEVQIGAFQSFNLDQYNTDLALLRNQEADGLHKYVLARFKEFSRAEAFVTDIRNIGINDAFIAGVIDGRRTTIDEAKEAKRNIP